MRAVVLVLGVLVLGVLGLGAAGYLRFRPGPAQAASRDEVAAALARERYARWRDLYADASLEQVRQEIPLLRAQLDAGTLDYYEREFRRGAYVLEGRFTRGESYAVRNPGDHLCARRFLENGEVAKVVLPREEFPEMYELRDQIAWLAHREEELTAWGGNAAAR